MRLLKVLALTAVFLTACGLSSAQQATLRGQAGLPGATSRSCADIFASALASPRVAVSGAWDCQDARLQSMALSSNVKTDEDIRHYADQPPHITITGSCPVVAGNHTYLITTSDPAHPTAILIIKVDPDGKVNFFTLDPATVCP